MYINLALLCDCVLSWIVKQLQQTLLGSSLCWTPCAMATLASFTLTISLTLCQLGWLVNLTFTHSPSVGGTNPTMGIPVPHGTQNEGSGMVRTFVPIVSLTWLNFCTPWTHALVGHLCGEHFQCALTVVLLSSSMAGSDWICFDLL